MSPALYRRLARRCIELSLRTEVEAVQQHLRIMAAELEAEAKAAGEFELADAGAHELAEAKLTG